MRVTTTAILPMLVTGRGDRVSQHCLRDAFLPGLDVAYSFGPPYGERLIGPPDLDRLAVNRRDLHRLAADNLRDAVANARVLGQPPTLMLAFDGLESSVLLDAAFWERLSGSVPGEVVVGVPARDVVIVTGSASPPGMAKIRRAVDRVFYAGGQHLLSRDLLVWREGAWEFLRPVRRPSGGAPPRPAPRPAPGPAGGPAPVPASPVVPEPAVHPVPEPASRPVPGPPPVPEPALYPVPEPTSRSVPEPGARPGTRPRPGPRRAPGATQGAARGTRQPSGPAR